MGTCYKLVNAKTKERIEPSQIGGRASKATAMICGHAAKLLAMLHVDGQHEWTFTSDGEGDLFASSEQPGHPNYMTERTEHYVSIFNRRYPEHAIGYAPPWDSRAPAIGNAKKKPKAR